MSDPARARQAAAIGALVLGLSGLGLAAVVAVQEFPRGLIALGLVALASAAAWYGVLRRGTARVLGLVVAAIALGAMLLLLIDDRLLEELLVAAALALSFACARAAFGVRTHLPRVPAPQRPVLFFNPRSGGGKAARFKLADEARARGIEPIELGPPWDLEQLARDAVAGGADGLAMAGGDGSQAIVASIAAELDLPYACIPAGTRNHFALDLGVDRDDVVGALDAFALDDSARELRTELPCAGPDGHRTRPNAQTHDEGDLMDIFEVEQKERMSREEVAARLRNLADMLARHNDIEFERGGMTFKVNVPDEVDVKVELEVESDKRELEIELTW